MFFAAVQQSMREVRLIKFMAVSCGIEFTGFRDDHPARIESYRILKVQRDFRPMFGTHRSRPNFVLGFGTTLVDRDLGRHLM